MIEFVFGRQQSEKTEYVIEKMQEALANGKRIILIIPEHQALFWDNLCATRFSPTDALNIESVSFTRLCNSAFRRFGGIAKTYATEAQKMLFMWSAVNAVQDRLSAFRSPEREDRYIPLFKYAASELKLYGVSGEELICAADGMDESAGTLPDRLRDLALISSAYDALLHQSHEDTEEMLDALDALLSENDFFSGSAVFIDSFLTLTPKEKKILHHIFRNADSALITFAMAEEDRKKDSARFISEYVKDVARIANLVGQSIKRTSIGEDRKAEFSYLSANLWNYAAEPFAGETDAVTVIKCADRYDEATLAALRIKALVKEGASFGDIACVAADFESLRKITDIELERHGIPVFVSGKTPVTSQPAVRLLLYASRVVSQGWKGDDIISAARTGLCALTPDETDALEVYTQKWRIRGKARFCIPDGWQMNADGYSESESPRAKSLLALANEAREKIVPPIEAFSEAFPGKVRDICAAAYKLLCDFKVYDQLRLEVAALEGEGRFADAHKKSQVWEALLQVLDILAETVPDEVADSRRFSALFSRVADTCLIGTIPDGIDRVSLGSVGGVRADSVKHLIVLGVKSGEFPRTTAEKGFFSDNDRLLLKKAGIEISPDTASAQHEELFRFKETVCAPKESVTLIIPSDGAQNNPSLGALRVMKLFPGCKTLDFTSPEAQDLIRTEGGKLTDFSTGRLSADLDRVTGEARRRLFDRDLRLTQSRIDCFETCPFQYYCKYILKLDEGDSAELKYGEVGTFVHYVLEHFMREAAEDGGFPISEEAVISRTERIIREYREKIVPRGQSGHIDYMFQRLSASIRLFARSLNEEFAQSLFEPHSFELKVGFSDDLPALPIPLENGHTLTVRGIVDRMDIMRRDGKVYIRVVDYKTGSKVFSLKDALKGHNIQLLLYLFALCNMPKDCSFAKKIAPDGEEIVPAGAVYFSAKPGDIAADDLLGEEDAQKRALDMISRTGIVMGDSAVIEAMDRDMNGKYAPAKYDAKGKLRGSFFEDRDAYDGVQTAINEYVCGVGNKMAEGFAASAPHGFKASSPCDNCSMKPLCRHSEYESTDERRDEGNE